MGNFEFGYGGREPIDPDLIELLLVSPDMPMEDRPYSRPQGVWLANEAIPGANSMADLLDEIDAVRRLRNPSAISG